MERRVEPQQFLDRRRGRRWRRKSLARIDFSLQHRFHAIADCVHRRFMASVQQKDAGRDQFLLAEAPLVGLGADKLADEIVAWRAAAHFDRAAQKRDKFAGRRHRAVLDGARHAKLIHRDHAMRPTQQMRRHLT